MSERYCSKPGCAEPAIATLSLDYDSAVAVVGPLSPVPEFGCLDLCSQHQFKFVPMQGWRLIRHNSLPGIEKGQK